MVILPEDSPMEEVKTVVEKVKETPINNLTVIVGPKVILYAVPSAQNPAFIGTEFFIHI